MMVPIIYNLFPTLVGPPAEWLPHAARARQMGFNWLYVNPFTYPGFSGSLYAVKDYERLHPLLGGPDAGLERLVPAVRAIRDSGLSVMMDLVINHTAKDSPLVTAHRDWYRRDARGEVVSPSAIDPANADHVTTWGDLAEIDNTSSPARDELWAYWERLVLRFLDAGFTGFRCDAAYKVPSALWRRLVAAVKSRNPDGLFVAETLGCRLEEVEALGEAGFDYFYNSSKWWDFREAWCLEQHAQFGKVPSISFPESHDTERLAAQTGGSESVQRQRYAFAAVFSAGVQLTIGYEFGFRRRLDVVTTSPDDWETPAFDLTGFVGRVNRLKRRHPLLQSEGVLETLPAGEDVTVLRRWSEQTGRHRGLILINRNTTGARVVRLDPALLPPVARLFRPCQDMAPEDGEPVPDTVSLAAAEVALVMTPLPS
jgi:starch synthase (maltosyl-transferring)